MTPAQKAGYWLLDYVYAARYQVKAVLDRTRPEDYLDPAAPGQPLPAWRHGLSLLGVKDLIDFFQD